MAVGVKMSGSVGVLISSPATPTQSVSCLIYAFVAFLRKGTGGVAGHRWSDSQGNRSGYVQVWSVWRQGHRKVVQRWRGGLAKRAHQNDPHWKVKRRYQTVLPSCEQSWGGFIDTDVSIKLHDIFCTACLRFHRLIIDNVKPEDAGDYTFVPDGYALSLSAKLNFLGEKDRTITKVLLWKN